jgi:S1-C subfamily serine protease
VNPTRLGAACLLALNLACGNDPQGPSPEVYDSLRRASVEVLVDDRLKGSGWFARTDGAVLTSAHVVAGFPRHPAEDAEKLQTRLARERVEVMSPTVGRLPAKIVAIDRGHDLALLQVARRSYPALPIARENPRAGDVVFLLGHMQTEHEVLLRGHVAQSQPVYVYFDDQTCYVRAVAINAMTGPGVSGAAWVNADGEVVAQMCGVMLHRKGRTGIAHATPSGDIAALLETGRSAHTPTLRVHVREVWDEDRDYLRRVPTATEGLVVQVVLAGSPLAEAKIVANDIILEVDGDPVRHRDDLLAAVRKKAPGDEVRLKVMRPQAAKAETWEVTVVLQRLEVAD